MDSIGTWWMWIGFFALVIIMLLLDLLLRGGRQHRVSFKEAAVWSGVWVTVALLFCAGLWWYLEVTSGRELANEKALEFLAGYLIEKSLAIDNVFVWLTIFSFFAVPIELQRRVLSWRDWCHYYAHCDGFVGWLVDRPVSLGALPLRSVPDRYRYQDVVVCE